MAVPPSLIGRTFGDFQVVCPLAAGGMASVYLARKQGPAQVQLHAALKVVHPHLATEREFVDMFLDEARIAACLRHPNLCLVLDFGMAEGTYYLALEYVLGETWSAVRRALAEHPEGRSLLPAIAAHVIGETCTGLHAAHEASDDHGRPLEIVHRDVSPQNIFVAYDGTVRVLDFGIARAADRITSTRAGLIKGRFAYMAPEQMLDEPIQRSADVWSCGVVLREALEGRRLFRRSSDAATIVAVSTEPLPPWRGQAPPALRAIAERALAREPAARFADAQAMGRELARFAAAADTPVDTALVSRWMHTLFPQSIAQKQARLVHAMSEPATSEAAAGAADSPVPSPSDGSGASDPWSLPSAPSSTPSAHMSAASTRPKAPRGWLTAPRPLAFLTLTLVGLATMLLTLGQRSARPRGSAPKTVRSTPGTSASMPAPVAPGPIAPATPEAGAAAQPPARQGGSPGPTASAEAARAKASGTLVVGFEGGWAEVYLAGRLLGTTPGRFAVRAGKPLLTIRPFGGGEAVHMRADVRPGAVTKLLLNAGAR